MKESTKKIAVKAYFISFPLELHSILETFVHANLYNSLDFNPIFVWHKIDD